MPASPRSTRAPARPARAASTTRSIAALSASRPRSTSRRYRSCPSSSGGQVAAGSMPTTTRFRGFEPRCRPSCSSLNPTDDEAAQHGHSSLTSSQHDPDTVPDSLGDLVASIRGRIVAPGDPGWDAARQAWNLAVDQRPALVAMPLDLDDVRAIVRYARHHRLRIAPQGTGHSAGALGSLADTILLSTRHMRGVEIDATKRIARVQAGTLWHEVTEATSPFGLYPLSGSSPDVGVVGVHARRRPELVGAPARPRREPGDGDRGRHRRRRGHAGQRRRNTRSCSGRCAVAEAASAS